VAVTERSVESSDSSLGKAFVLTGGGLTIEVIEFGARLSRCLVPDAAGVLADVVPGFDTPRDYQERGGSTGAICGRYGNRIGNARFELDGVTYNLSANDSPNSLHGGFKHFGKHLWKGVAVPEDNAVRLTLQSPDGDEGWPGNVEAEVTYRLTEEAEVCISMRATSDAATYLNLIFHGYWNLAGHESGTVHDQLLKSASSTYLPKDEVNLPTGERCDVRGTPFDFLEPTAIGTNIGATGQGYDHNFCLDGYTPGEVTEALRMLDPDSGRAMVLSTDQPGVQVFTGNSWAGVKGKDGASYNAHDAIAFETQLFPNTPNMPAFGPVPIRPGDVYRHEMVMQFLALDPSETEAFFKRT
jgi:aldose 1-epimerase